MAIEYLVEVIIVVLEDHAHWAVVVPLGLDNAGKPSAIHPPHHALLPPQHGVVQHHVPGDIQGGRVLWQAKIIYTLNIRSWCLKIANDIRTPLSPSVPG